MAGVVRTRVGYAGGAKADPTYRSLGDHTETIQIDWNPEKVSYEQLLEVFWGSHNPTYPPMSRQYMSAIFYADSAQKELAELSKQRIEAQLGKKVYTEILPLERFYLAEDHHQKYYLRNSPELVAELRAIYPNEADWIDSTAAARLNGYAGGYIALSDLR